MSWVSSWGLTNDGAGESRYVVQSSGTTRRTGPADNEEMAPARAAADIRKKRHGRGAVAADATFWEKGVPATRAAR